VSQYRIRNDFCASGIGPSYSGTIELVNHVNWCGYSVLGEVTGRLYGYMVTI